MSIGQGLQSLQVGLVSERILRWLGLDSSTFSIGECHAKFCDYLQCNFRLDRERVLKFAIVAARPDLRVIGHSDDLRRNAHRCAVFRALAPSYRAVQNVICAQGVTDLPHSSRRFPIHVSA